MIALLRGTAHITDDEVCLEVNGVGYQVSVGPTTLERLRQSQQNEALLFIHTHVREDSIKLYGFESHPEKKSFELVLSVSGVGPQTALHVVSKGAQALSDAIREADIVFFTAFPRVGKKLAQKIIIELRDHLGALESLDLPPLSKKHQDVVGALQSLGFDEAAAEQATQKLDIESQSVEQSIKQALTQLKHG